MGKVSDPIGVDLDPTFEKLKDPSDLLKNHGFHKQAGSDLLTLTFFLHVKFIVIYILYVQEVVTHFIYLTYYINWVTILLGHTVWIMDI